MYPNLNRSSDTHTYRVVTLISIENLWESQIIVFKNDDYFHNFFNRNNEFQKWISLSNEIDFWKTWGISICPTAQILHFQEVIYDEDAIDKKRFGLLESYLKRGTLK